VDAGRCDIVKAKVAFERFAVLAHLYCIERTGIDTIAAPVTYIGIDENKTIVLLDNGILGAGVNAFWFLAEYALDHFWFTFPFGYPDSWHWMEPPFSSLGNAVGITMFDRTRILTGMTRNT